MMPSDLKKVFARRRKSAPYLFMAPIISPSHNFAFCPITASSGGKWNYIVCTRCTVTFFPCGCAEQLDWFYTYIILKDESPDNVVCFYLISPSPSTGGYRSCFPI